ncbi:MAG: DUF2254 domain-containing protein [Alphaproteobacteria bacterium]|nr:DUF2254 domain-containing protein [Alphaproteobacteria bacterium]
MRSHLLKFYYDLRASYWFIPLIMVICAVILSFVTVQIDRDVGVEWLRSINWLYINQPDGARAVLSTIAGSMITVAGVTFSMTMVSVSFASSQFGPRLIGNFMRDQGNQLTLGTFIATFVYCLMVLRSVRTAESGPANASDLLTAFVPHLSLLCGLGLALASVMVLIYFIHHIPETINISNITASIGNELRRGIQKMFPEAIGEVAERKNLSEEEITKIFEDSVAISANHHGFIQTLDEKNLLKIAMNKELVVRLEYRPGDFCTEQEILMHVAPAERIDEEIEDALRNCVAWGNERTSTQNIMFLVDQLLEMIARALSSGVNDPYTAMNCMNWLKCALAELGGRAIPEYQRYDENNQLRVIAHPISFAHFADTIFKDVRQYVAADRNATLHMMKIIADIGPSMTEEYKQILLHHAEELHKSCQNQLRCESAKDEIMRRHELVKYVFKNPHLRESLRDNQGWLGGGA